MADLYIGKNAERMNVSPQFDGYSKVIIYTGETDEEGNEIIYSAGDTTGRTLKVTNPWANQATAEDILAKIRGWAYQPYEAETAIVNPAAEIGDSVVLNDTYSGIYKQTERFTALFNADISAPHDEEIDHEYTYESESERVFMRRLEELTATLTVYTGSIEAKVDKVSDKNESFGWKLTETGWTVSSQNGVIFYIDENGAYVKGEIQAESGKVGGFDIGQNAIYKGLTSLSDDEHNGVYVGTDGISLGKGNFKVDAAGNVYALNGTFGGEVFAKNIQYDGEAGFLSGAGIATDHTLGSDNFLQGVVDSLGFADFSNDVFTGNDEALYVKARYLVAGFAVSAPTYMVDDGTEEGYQGTVNKHTHEVIEKNGKFYIGPPDFSGTKHPFNLAGTEQYEEAVSAARIQGAESVRLTKLYVNAAGEPYDYNNKKYADVLVEYTLSSANGYGTPYINEITKAIDVTAVWEAAGGGQSEVSVSSIYSTRFASNYQTVYVRAMLSDGSISNEFAIDISTAWNNGYETGWNNVDVSWSDGSYDIWITGRHYNPDNEVDAVKVTAKLTNGQPPRESAYLYF